MNVDTTDICDQTPLHVASAQGMLDIVRALLRKKANINAKDSKGWTPLHCAANEQQYHVCEVLIHHKADLTATTQDQASVFAYAVKGQRDSEKQIHILSLLLSKCPKLLDQPNRRKETPIIRACLSSSLETVRFLFDHNADINNQTIEGTSCLHNAVRSRSKDIVEFLIANKADFNLTNNNNHTALEEAVAFSDNEMASFLRSIIPSPAKRSSVVAELIHVFNKNSINGNNHNVPQIVKRRVPSSPAATADKDKLPAVPLSRPRETENVAPVRDEITYLKPVKASSKRFSSLRKKRLSVEIPKEKKDRIHAISHEEVRKPCDSESLPKETEKLLQLLSQVDITGLCNSSEIAAQMEVVSSLLPKASSKSYRNDSGSSFKEKFVPSQLLRTNVGNSAHNTPGSIIKHASRRKSTPESKTSNNHHKEDPFEESSEESGNQTDNSNSNSASTPQQKTKSRKIANTINNIASMAVSPITTLATTAADEIDKIDLEDYFSHPNRYIDELHLPEYREMNTSITKLPSKDSRQRMLTFEEILTTETQYVRHLGAVVAYFIRPLQNELAGLISPKDLQSIFCNIEDIFKTSSDLLQQLLGENTKPSQEQRIGEIFSSFSKDFTAYTLYCTSQLTAAETLERLAENKLFNDFIYRSKQHSDKLINEPLDGYLIKPFQRICRYVLLLKELHKHTPANWSDCADLRVAIENTETVVRRANETQRVMDNLTKIDQIQAKLDVELDFKRAVKFIMEGDVKEIEKGHLLKRHFFLFNSLLVVVKHGRSGKWINKHSLPIEKCIVWNMSEVDGQKYCFQIVRTDCTDKIIFSCKSEKEKEEFMSNINEAISPNLFSLLS